MFAECSGCVSEGCFIKFHEKGQDSTFVKFSWSVYFETVTCKTQTSTISVLYITNFGINRKTWYKYRIIPKCITISSWKVQYYCKNKDIFPTLNCPPLRKTWSSLFCILCFSFPYYRFGALAPEGTIRLVLSQNFL